MLPSRDDAIPSANMEAVKVITAVPPEDMYPKSQYPYMPLRLLPISPFADVGKCYEWSQLKEMVRCSPVAVVSGHLTLLLNDWQQVLRQNKLSSGDELLFVAKHSNACSQTEQVIRSDADFKTALKVCLTNHLTLPLINYLSVGCGAQR